MIRTEAAAKAKKSRIKLKTNTKNNHSHNRSHRNFLIAIKGGNFRELQWIFRVDAPPLVADIDNKRKDKAGQ